MQPMTLYELNSLVQEMLETSLPDEYWVQGELTEGRVGYGGHFYGELVQRDERDGRIIAKARVTCWANIYNRVGKDFETMTGESLRPGLSVMVLVGVGFHPQYGFSLSIQDIDPSFTLGASALRRQEILHRLEADGILYDNQTLPLPMLTLRIAVVSSESAAGYGDFCNQLLNNDYGFQFRIGLFAAVMQGNRVEASVSAALQRVADEVEQWDVVVIIRGGGATSDLSDFDSYPLAACVAQMPLPVITGIGHERDETVLDYVAHTRQKTPTAVAAFLIDHLAESAMRLDELGQRLSRVATDRLAQQRERLGRLSAVLPLSFRAMRDAQLHQLERLSERLIVSYRERRQQEFHHLELLHHRFQGLDPTLLLQRGFSMTFVGGCLVRSVEEVQRGQVLTTRFVDGQVKSIAD